MSELDILFYILGFNTLVMGLGVILSRNPLFSALFLVLSMISVAGLFMTLNAVFIAAVQVIVYAGAVLVLFVLVLMLFDLRHEVKAFTRGKVTGFMKLAFAGALAAAFIGPVLLTGGRVLPPVIQQQEGDTALAADKTQPQQNAPTQVEAEMEEAKALSQLIFTKYIFAFEIIGLLLLVIPVGVVTLSRVPGGTHVKH